MSGPSEGTQLNAAWDETAAADGGDATTKPKRASAVPSVARVFEEDEATAAASMPSLEVLSDTSSDADADDLAQLVPTAAWRCNRCSRDSSWRGAETSLCVLCIGDDNGARRMAEG